MAKKRANGEGNIRKRKDGSLGGPVHRWHDPESGKAILQKRPWPDPGRGEE